MYDTNKHDLCEIWVTYAFKNVNNKLKASNLLYFRCSSHWAFLTMCRRQCKITSPDAYEAS